MPKTKTVVLQESDKHLVRRVQRLYAATTANVRLSMREAVAEALRHYADHLDAQPRFEESERL